MIKQNAQRKIIISSTIINLFLSSLKLVTGWLFHSLPMIADGFNSMSDVLVSLVSLIANKFAQKPADDNHPLGHGRIEYLVSLLISIIFIYVSFSVIVSSINQIISPSKELISSLLIIILIVSIFIKIVYYFFLKKHELFKNSLIVQALAKDSFFDLITNIGILIGFLCSLMFSINIDGYLGLIIGFIMLVGSLKILYDTSNLIVGIKIDENLLSAIESIVMDNPIVLGFHNLVIHDYGINNKKGNIDIELPYHITLEKAHQIIDQIEYNIYEQLGIDMVIHSDPIKNDDFIQQKIIEELKQNFVNIGEFDVNFIQGHQRQSLIIRLKSKYNLQLSHDLKAYFKTKQIETLIIFNDDFKQIIKGKI